MVKRGAIFGESPEDAWLSRFDRQDVRRQLVVANEGDFPAFTSA